MPIRPENRHLYPADWPAIRKRILERAGNRCERCLVPNHTMIWRGVFGCDNVYELVDQPGILFDADSGWMIAQGFGYSIANDPGVRMVRVVLTIAHVHDPNPANVEDDNLAAWCQRCHNRHDMLMRIQNARTRRRARLAIRDLFPAP
ncbi:MAG TPA: hypothetical protein PKZ76_03520 [Xanthomonadaceae bacterium]|nr:hypothetical protein [Xanthomonadaceae bacterium]